MQSVPSDKVAPACTPLDDMPEGVVLHAVQHRELIAGVQMYADRAGIDPQCVWTPVGDVCSDDEVDYLRDLKSQHVHGTHGLVYVEPKSGKRSGPNKEDRMMAMAGACLRNFIDARLIPFHTLLKAVVDGDAPEPTVLFIPNLLTAKLGTQIPNWHVDKLYSYLLARRIRGLQTVVYVHRLAALGECFGADISGLVAHHYERVVL